MTLTPRLVVVESASIRAEDQSLQLVTLSREASAEFYQRFPKGEQRNLGEMMSFVRENALTYLGKPSSSHPARRIVELEGTKYHMGDVLTEKEAFDLGYHEPHIETQCGRIGQLVHCYRERGGLEHPLREEGLINEDQAIVRKSGELHVVQRDQAEHYRRNRVKGINDSERPITLLIFDPEDGTIPVGCAVYVESVNGIYEFMTRVPLVEE